MADPKAIARLTAPARKLPSAEDLEEAVLGTMLQSQKVIPEVLDMMPAGAMSKASHSHVMQAIINLNEQARPVDIMTVTQELRKMGQLDAVGGPFFVSQLTNKISSDANLEAHVRILIQHHILRQVILLSGALSNLAYKPTTDAFDLVDYADQQLQSIQSVISSQAPPITLAEKYRQIADNTTKAETFVLQLDDDMDRKLRVTPTMVMTIGARPAVGKTAVMLAIIRNLAQQGVKVGVISLEMTPEQLAARSASTDTGIDSNSLTFGDINDDERDRVAQILQRSDANWLNNVFLDPSTSLHVKDIKGLFWRLRNKYGIKVISLDYLQLVQSDERDGTKHMEVICNTLKSAAMSVGVFLVELSQLTKEAAGVRPEPKHLRGAGQIEAASDIIIMLDRERGGNRLELYLDKYKYGPLGSWSVNFDLTSQHVGNPRGLIPQALPPSILNRSTLPEEDNIFDTNIF